MSLVLPTSALSETEGAGHRGLAALIGERSLAFGGQTFLAHARSERTVTFGSLAGTLGEWRADFESRALAPGSTVAVVVADPLDFATAFLAIVASGHFAAPLDPGGPDEGPGGLAASLSQLGAGHVVADRPAPLSWDGGWAEIGDRSYRAGAQRSAEPDHGTPPDGGGTRGGVILASSGTTGRPKIIRLAESQLLHVAERVAEHHALSTDDRGFNPLPLFHINAEVVGLLASLVAGSCLVLDDRFHRTEFWTLMDRHRVTWINAVPAIIAFLAERGPDEVIPSRIRFIRSASAPLPVATLSRFEANIAIPVLETYGMTEAASQITANPLKGIRKAGSVGLPVGVDLRIVPEEAPEAASPGQGPTVGHVEIRGPSVITSYGHDGAPGAIDGDGWLRTGDLGHLDGDGYLYLDGRTDDVINRGGEKVFPREIEEVILMDPGVAAVSVVGQDHPVLGQVPVAFLVLHGVMENSTASAVEAVVARIGRSLDAGFGRSKRPHALHVVSALPVGATGKVQRRVLRAQAVTVLSSSVPS